MPLTKMGLVRQLAWVTSLTVAPARRARANRVSPAWTRVACQSAGVWVQTGCKTATAVEVAATVEGTAVPSTAVAEPLRGLAGGKVAVWVGDGVSVGARVAVASKTGVISAIAGVSVTEAVTLTPWRICQSSSGESQKAINTVRMTAVVMTNWVRQSSTTFMGWGWHWRGAPFAPWPG